MARQLETLRLPKKQKTEESPEEEAEPEEQIIEFNNEIDEEPWAPEPAVVEVDEAPMPEPEMIIPTPTPAPVVAATNENEEDTIDVQVEVHQELVEDDKAINKRLRISGIRPYARFEQVPIT